jgi:hypothetical protein
VSPYREYGVASTLLVERYVLTCIDIERRLCFIKGRAGEGYIGSLSYTRRTGNELDVLQSIKQSFGIHYLTYHDNVTVNIEIIH